MSSSNSYYIELITHLHVYLYRYVGIIMYILGMIGNILAIHIFMKKSWRKNVCVFYFLVCLFSNTIYINTALLGGILIYGFNINFIIINIIICKLYIFLSYSFSTYFPIILILSSIDRLLISSQKIDTRLYSSKRLAYILIGVSVLIWNLFSLHVLIKVSIQEIYPTIFVCYYDPSASYQNFYAYSNFIILLSIYSTIIILSTFSFKNVRHIRPVPRQQRHQLRSMTKKDFQLLCCLYIQNINYIVFSLITIISAIYSAIMRYRTQTLIEQALNTFLTHVGYFTMSISYCTSFFIFIGVSKTFRQEFKRIIYKIIGKDLRTLRNEEHNQNQSAIATVETNNILTIDAFV